MGVVIIMSLTAKLVCCFFLTIPYPLLFKEYS